jgi:hypothetical protein
MPRALDAEIDRLYQLPLEAFTPERNALAKRAGADGARIKALVKPPIAAWAVNQLFWKQGNVWNALIAASENARKAHRAVLAGKSGDVRAAGKVHDEAVEAAVKATLAVLEEAGHPATDATRHTIATTLRALPAEEAPGRLTRALQPAGFEMLSGFTVATGSGRGAPKPAPSRPAAGGEGSSAAPKVDAQVLTKAKHAAASAVRTLREAETAARREEFEKARTEREEKRAADALLKARQALTDAEAALKEAEQAAEEAESMRRATAQRARDAQKAVEDARARAEATAADLAAIEKGKKPR